MAVRGSAIVNFNGTPVIIGWPAGTLAGDLAMIIVEAAYNITSPSGWTNHFLANGHTANGLLASKILTAGDISTGFVAVSMAGSYPGTASIVTMVGGAMREVQGNWDGGSGGPFTVMTSDTTLIGDIAIYVANARNNATITVSRGTTLKTQTLSEQCAVINSETLTSEGSYVSVNFNMANSGSGLVFGAFVTFGSGVASGGGGGAKVEDHIGSTRIGANIRNI